MQPMNACRAWPLCMGAERSAYPLAGDLGADEHRQQRQLHDGELDAGDARRRNEQAVARVQHAPVHCGGHSTSSAVCDLAS